MYSVDVYLRVRRAVKRRDEHPGNFSDLQPGPGYSEKDTGLTLSRRATGERVSYLSLIRYRTNDCSVPVAYGLRDIIVRGYVDRVVISCGSEIIASHPRSYERDDSSTTPSTTCRCWSGRSPPRTRRPHCRLGSCPMSPPPCVVSWSPA